MTIHPQVIEKGGKKEFVVLPYQELIRIQEALEDFEDLKELRREKKRSARLASIPLDEVVKRLGL